MSINVSHTHHTALARQCTESKVLFTIPPNVVVEVPDNVALGLSASFGDLVTLHDVAPPKVEDDKPAVAATADAIKLAEQHGIDLATLTGSGSEGKVNKADVQDEIDRIEKAAKDAENSGGSGSGTQE